MENICRICGQTDDHPTFTGREMMFGTQEEFEYFQCLNCSCLQIAEIPADLSRHYPSSYIAHNVSQSCENNLIKAFLLKQRFRNAIFDRGYKLNKLLGYFLAMPDFRLDGVLSVAQVLKVSQVKNFSARILDVGCGNWSIWLERLRHMGFNDLTGVDPMIPKDVAHCGIRILKRHPHEISGKFDLITLNHSLEHMVDQKSSLTSAMKLLAPGGVILVRIPIVSSHAWKRYGTSWVEMDPPRHLYLHSKTSIELLGRQVGLEPFEVIHDTKSFEFWGSEQYKRNIPLTAQNSYWINPSLSIFSQSDIDNFDSLSIEANKNKTAGRAAFFFRTIH